MNTHKKVGAPQFSEPDYIARVSQLGLNNDSHISFQTHKMVSMIKHYENTPIQYIENFITKT